MYRIILAAALALGLAGTAPVAQAQGASTRSYAPENLRQLSVQDRIRVLETEYAEQSNGRRLPRDQRDFYLAQINSGWSFSRIKSDMAQSLRGSDHGNNGGNPGGSGRTVRCESTNQQLRECRTNFRGQATLSRRLSKAECVEGRSWGQGRGIVWVNRGCRAEFTEGLDSGGHPGGSEYNVTCSSDDDRYRTCAWNNRYGRPYLIEKLSRTECVEGRNWGYQGNAIWVDGGCRGRFAPRR